MVRPDMTTTESTARSTFEEAWNEWHHERERYYGDPLGWVSLTGLYWLTDEFETGRRPAWSGGGQTPMRCTWKGIDGIERLEPVEGAPGLLVPAG